MGQEAQKRFWSYEQIHKQIADVVAAGAFDEWRPTLLLCIASGGFVPTRVLRSQLKERYGGPTPRVLTIGLQLYDVEGLDPATAPVQRTQWLAYGDGPGEVRLRGERVLLVDEVDDSRKTLAAAVAQLRADVAAERAEASSALAANGGGGGGGEAPPAWAEPELGVFVVHNKRRPKLAELPHGTRYFVGEEIDNVWCAYPWDAESYKHSIYEHTRLAEGAAAPGARHERRQSSGCPPAGDDDGGGGGGGAAAAARGGSGGILGAAAAAAHAGGGAGVEARSPK